MRLTKTDILAGLQCHKQLFLLKNHPEYKKPINTPAMITGVVVEEHARKLFSNPVLVSRFKKEADPFEETQNYISNSSYDAIFQAGFRANDVEVFVDVLEREGDAWNIIEIKASTEIKNHFIDDLTIQYFTARETGLSVGRAKLMHINKDFDYKKTDDYSDLFVIEEVTDRVRTHLATIEQQIDRLKEVLKLSQPEIPISSHCNNPNPCEFRAYCEESGPKYPVGQLPYGGAVIKKLHANHIYDIRDIPIEMLSSDNHKRVHRITLEGKPELDQAVGKIVSELAYPRYYLDFEGIQFAIPIWKNAKAFQQLPFQFSCHIEKDSSSLTHEEFLDVSGSDPRRALAEALLKACGKEGPIIVYYQAYEKKRIEELADLFPDLSESLLQLNDRVWDLWPVVRAHYYHPEMKGSWSIKKVLSCLVPELSYSELGAVQDGTQAQQAYFDLIGNTLDENQKNQLIDELRQYCKLDTLAMVEIVRKLARGEVH